MHIQSEIALFVVGLWVIYMAAKIIRAVYLNAGVERNLCPNCGTTYIRRSSPRRFADLPYRLFGLRPYRCTLCEIRFFAYRAPSEVMPAAERNRAAELRQ